VVEVKRHDVRAEALMSYFGNRLTIGYTDLLYADIMNLDYGKLSRRTDMDAHWSVIETGGTDM
jgi:hypothetical protein